MLDRWVTKQQADFVGRGADIASRSLNVSRVNIALEFVGTNKKVLDLGCNDGAIANRIRNMGNYVLGVDLPEVTKIAERKNPGIEYVSCDLSEGLPFEDEEFDVVVALELIEHLVDDEFFLNECNRVIRKGGKLIISTPNVAFIRNRAWLLFGKFMKDNLHFHLYTFKELRGKLRAAGFTSII